MASRAGIAKPRAVLKKKPAVLYTVHFEFSCEVAEFGDDTYVDCYDSGEERAAEECVRADLERGEEGSLSTAYKSFKKARTAAIRKFIALAAKHRVAEVVEAIADEDEWEGSDDSREIDEVYEGLMEEYADTDDRTYLALQCDFEHDCGQTGGPTHAQFRRSQNQLSGSLQVWLVQKNLK